MKPTLLVIDLKAHTWRRYVPKVLGGFFTEEGTIGEPGDDISTLGTTEGLQIIEDARLGRLSV